jgi:hypothetical protein
MTRNQVPSRLLSVLLSWTSTVKPQIRVRFPEIGWGVHELESCHQMCQAAPDAGARRRAMFGYGGAHRYWASFLAMSSDSTVSDFSPWRIRETGL